MESMAVARSKPVGQRVVYRGDMANPSGEGVVARILAGENPISGGVFCGAYTLGKKGLVPLDCSVSYDIVLSDGRIKQRILAGHIADDKNDHMCRFYWTEGAAGAEETAGLLANAAAVKAQKAAAEGERKVAFEQAKAAARAEGLKIGLIPEAEFKGRGSAAVWNLRRELKAAGVKARVVQSSLSSIEVHLHADQAPRDDIKAICSKYEAGRFDGMTDCYEYVPRAWGSVFGDVRYVFTYC